MKEENLVGCAKSMVDFMGNKYGYNCLGCEIANKKITPPGGIVYEDESFVLAGDPEVPLNGFLIVNTKRHIKSLIEMTQKERYLFIDLTNKAINVLKELDLAKEVVLVQEERSSHFHLWIFPQQDWMIEKFGKGVSHLRNICSYLVDNATEEDKKTVLATIEKIKEKF